MQVNTKEILLNHPSKGLAQCALHHTTLPAPGLCTGQHRAWAALYTVSVLQRAPGRAHPAWSRTPSRATPSTTSG